MLRTVPLVVLLSGSVLIIELIRGEETYFKKEENQIRGKFFPFFSVVRFANTQCTARHNLSGTCFTRRECSNYGGTPSGTCASGHGVCCVFQKSCGSTTNVNNTYFINPDYPGTYKGGERCTLTVYRCNPDICQLRLDFLESCLSQPNATGYCDQDTLLVSGASTSVPRICGENANQHVYMEFHGGAPITISIDTNSGYNFDRRWNIKVQQIACDSTSRAPVGCLQYYDAVTDTAMSFNYGTSQNSRAPDIGTRQMANTNYGVCVRMADGYCGIEWSQSDTISFSVSGDTGSFDPAITDPELAEESGISCGKDFVIIPHPFRDGEAVGVERFCGNGFVTKTSYSKPFVMYVVTDGDEDTEIQNKGFMLTYRQLPCAV